MLELRDNISENLSKIIKAPANQISLIITMLCVIPFSFLNYFIHGRKLRYFNIQYINSTQFIYLSLQYLHIYSSNIMVGNIQHFMF